MMKSLKVIKSPFHRSHTVKPRLTRALLFQPFSHTFFSEWFLSPERDGADPPKLDHETKVGTLISLDDDKGKGKEEGESEWTTESGQGSGYHSGL